MKVGSLITPWRLDTKRPSADLAGSFFAERELLTAALSLDATLEVDFWCDLTGLQAPTDVRLDREELAEFFGRGKFGERVQVRSLAELETLCNDEYLFICGLPMLPQLHRIRQQMAKPFAICAVAHSICTERMFNVYTEIAKALRDYDSIVATSAAAWTSLDMLLRDAMSGEIVDPRLNRGKTNQITQIPLGVDTPQLDRLPDKKTARRILDLPDDAFVLVYIGRVSASYKADLDCLILALRQLETSTRAVWLVIAGFTSDADYSRQLDRLIEACGVGDRVIRIDNFPESAKSILLRACDVFVSPVDSVQESFGLSVLEAMALERPVIASSWSGYRDLIEDGVTGHLLATYMIGDSLAGAVRLSPVLTAQKFAGHCASQTILDIDALVMKVQAIAGDPACMARMGDAARARVVERFSWQTVAPKYLQLWRRQIGEVEKAAVESPAIVPMWFLHYADRVQSLNGTVHAMTSLQELQCPLAHLWRLSDGETEDQLERLAALCRVSPQPVAELLDQGFDASSIAWLLKKGLCRLEGNDGR